MKVLNVYRSLASSLSVGWERDDISIAGAEGVTGKVIHVFAQAEPGQPFQANDGHGNPHWPCEVCAAHGYTEAHFHAQVREALERGPDNQVTSERGAGPAN